LEDKGYTPEQAVEIQTLTGDTIDNIPGAKGVGIKTATKLIANYGDADAVMLHLDELTPKLRENLAAHAEHMALTRSLVTLDRATPIEFELEACVTPEPRRQKLQGLFEELGFRAFLDQLVDTSKNGADKAEQDALAVADPSEEERGQ